MNAKKAKGYLVENSFIGLSRERELKCIFALMKNVQKILILALMLGLTSCKALQESRKSVPEDGPKFEHGLFGDKEEKVKKPKRAEETKAREERDLSEGKKERKEKKDLAVFVEEWYGTPHRMGGTTKNGVDCSGFVIVAYREVFEKEFSGRRAEDIFAEVDPIRWEEMEHGDLVFFKVKGRRIDHVGIYLGDGKFAHTSSSRGVMISELSNPYWSKRFFKAGRQAS